MDFQALGTARKEDFEVGSQLIRKHCKKKWNVSSLDKDTELTRKSALRLCLLACILFCACAIFCSALGTVTNNILMLEIGSLHT